MSRLNRLLRPETLFGRTALALALAFLLFGLFSVILLQFTLVRPQTKQAANDVPAIGGSILDNSDRNREMIGAGIRSILSLDEQDRVFLQIFYDRRDYDLDMVSSAINGTPRVTALPLDSRQTVAPGATPRPMPGSLDRIMRIPASAPSLGQISVGA